MTASQLFFYGQQTKIKEKSFSKTTGFALGLKRNCKVKCVQISGKCNTSDHLCKGCASRKKRDPCKGAALVTQQSGSQKGYAFKA